LAGETEVLGENLPQRHFVRHKIPHDRPSLDPRTAEVEIVSDTECVVVQGMNKIKIKIYLYLQQMTDICRTAKKAFRINVYYIAGLSPTLVTFLCVGYTK
jgi:hypothetical protein